MNTIFPYLRDVFKSIKGIFEITRGTTLGRLKYVVLLIGLFYSTLCWSSVDSLLIELSNSKGTVRVDLLNKLSEQLRRPNADTAITLAIQAKEHAIEIKYKFGQVRALDNISMAKFIQGKTQEALKIGKETYQLAILVGDKSEIGNALTSLNIFYENTDSFDSALIYGNKALQVFEDLKDEINVSYAHNNLATTYYKLGDYPEALEHYLESLSIKERLKDDSEIASTLANIALVYKKQNNYQKAMEFNYRSVPYAKKTNNTFGLSITYSNMGTLHRRLNNHDSALFYLDKSEKLSVQINDLLGIALVQINKGDVFFSQKTFSKALKYYEHGLASLEKLNGSQQYLLIVHHNLSKTHSILSNFENAIIHGLIAFEMANDINSNPWIQEVAFNLYEIFKAQKRTVKALEYYELSSQYKDSLFNEQKLKEINLLETNFEIEKRERQIELLTAQNELTSLSLSKKKREHFFTVVIIVLILIFGLFSFWIISNRSKLKQQLLMTEIDQLRVQLKGVLEGNSDSIGLDKNKLNDILDQGLSEREFEILNYAVSDLNNKQIAEKVFVSVNTVKFHLKNIYEKLGVHNRKEALQFAFRVNNP